ATCGTCDRLAANYESANAAVQLQAHSNRDQQDPQGMEHPQAAIDAFVKLVEPESEVMWKGYQLILKKTSGGPRHALRHPRLDCFVIAVVTNDAYAAAVAIKSVVSTCSDPVKLAFFVVVVRGLSQASRNHLETLAPNKLFFVDGPAERARIFLDELLGGATSEYLGGRYVVRPCYIPDG
ncbi:MAG: hypothetical protein AAF629_21045, partial [Chloroflexota bacterium]